MGVVHVDAPSASEASKALLAGLGAGLRVYLKDLGPVGAVYKGAGSVEVIKEGEQLSSDGSACRVRYRIEVRDKFGEIMNGYLGHVPSWTTDIENRRGRWVAEQTLGLI